MAAAEGFRRERAEITELQRIYRDAGFSIGPAKLFALARKRGGEIDLDQLKNISLDYRNINNIGIIFDYLRSKFEFILTISHKQEIRQHINYQIHLRQDENKLSYVVN